ncbi:MAG: CARDB domain-containing protein, partial [Candidatus Thermoplasmatota archaeon]|nr:CARDB domain-containing protein [Candidatus Thermoplasmatota archaeon]
MPTDPNGRTSGSGARFVAMELTSTTEVFSFRAPNGYADAAPLPVDTDGDGIHDRLCWVTWYSTSATSFNRQGMAGCHDITADPPVKEWSRTMERGSGNDNDEIAVAPPLWIDVDGDGPAELLVAFGRKLHCFDGETGAPTDVSTPWEDPVSLPHRTWAAPAAGDMDGDGHLDILIGDMLISQRQADLQTLSDGRALFFTPEDPDPGEAYTVSARFENVGTEAAQDEVDAVLLKDGDVISRYRLDDLEPIDPSGEGTTASFSVGLTASLGTSEFKLILDPNNNITEAREDNNEATFILEVRPPYAVDLAGPVEAPTVAPGATERVEVEIMSTGTRDATWEATWTDESLPEGWSLTAASPTQFALTAGEITTMAWDLTVPNTALGDEEGWFDVKVEREGDAGTNATVRVPVEVLRTRGLDMEGPDGTATSTGSGRPGDVASAWFSIENLGNAAETTTSIDWSTSTWGSPRVEDAEGQEQYTLTLQPDEFRMLRASVDVPSNVGYGASIVVDLTVCIGEGEGELCRVLAVTFHASRTT